MSQLENLTIHEKRINNCASGSNASGSDDSNEILLEYFKKSDLLEPQKTNAPTTLSIYII